MIRLRPARLLWILAGPPALIAVVAMGLMPAGRATPAYACSGGVSPLEYYAGLTRYVAVVEVVAVGGPENSAPTATPPGTPYPTPAVTRTPVVFDLTGIGAELRVVDDLLGNAPPEFDIDNSSRELTEMQLRHAETDSNIVSPCPIGFLVPKYEVGQRWLVIAGAWEGQSETSTLARYRVEGDSVLIGMRGGDGLDWWLMVHSPTYDAAFAGLPFWNQGPDTYGNLLYQIEAPSVPLESFRAAVQYLMLEAEPTPTPPLSTPPPTLLPSGTVRISPPDTGSAGLK